MFASNMFLLRSTGQVVLPDPELLVFRFFEFGERISDWQVDGGLLNH
jgi:hypothetical protein